MGAVLRMVATTSRVLLAAMIGISGIGSVEAFSLKKAIKDVGKVVKSVPKAAASIPNPLTTQIDIVTGKTKPKDVVASEGEKLKTLANEGREADNIVQSNLADAGQAVGGNLERILVEASTGATRYSKEFLLTTTDATASIMQGQDPLIALATPLAAAIRDARNNYNSSAKPLHDGFKKLLAPFIPANILNRTRYSVDNLRITLPSLINKSQKVFGDDYAVTVDDIIVFIREPDPNNPSDIEWVAHELHHVHQYARWGVDFFALNYIRNHTRVEAEA
ncbi:MAG: DUF4157 domain-containing protein [Hyphomicrobiaceae bacterium]